MILNFIAICLLSIAQCINSMRITRIKNHLNETIIIAANLLKNKGCKK